MSTLNDKLLSIILSMPFFIGSGVMSIVLFAFAKFNKKLKKQTKIILAVLATVLLLFFIALLILSFLFSHNHPPASPM